MTLARRRSRRGGTSHRDDAPAGGWTIDRWLAVAAVVASTFTAVGVFIGGARIAAVDSDRQAKVDGSLTEAAAIQACLDYQRFVIEQHRAGLSEEAIAKLAGGVIALPVAEDLYVRDCPGVGEILNTVQGIGLRPD
jgi:lactam utilization protein B